MLRHGEIMMIHHLKEEGLSISEIARRMGLDRKTVRKYLQRGLEPPVYGPRPPRKSILDPYQDFIRTRLQTYPALTATRLMREIRDLGYQGSYTTVKRFVCQVRPPDQTGYEHRFETPAGKQAQVDFAQFKVQFTREPTRMRIVWLFSLVLGFSRLLFCRFVLRQDLATVVRCHLAAFGELGGVPRQILYDRMKTAVIGEQEQHIIYNQRLLDLARHFGFTPRACGAYRAKTKGKVERPYRYVRQDFFLGREFRDLEDLNAQLTCWLAEVANVRVHGTTGRIVNEAFAEEQPALLPLPETPYRTVLRLERRVSRDGMVSVDGNEYSVPDTTRRRIVEVQVTAQEVLILEDGSLVAVHPVLEGRGRRRIAEGHRRFPPPGNAKISRQGGHQIVTLPGQQVCRRDLEIYDRVATRLASSGRST